MSGANRFPDWVRDASGYPQYTLGVQRTVPAGSLSPVEVSDTLGTPSRSLDPPDPLPALRRGIWRPGEAS